MACIWQKWDIHPGRVFIIVLFYAWGKQRFSSKTGAVGCLIPEPRALISTIQPNHTHAVGDSSLECVQRRWDRGLGSVYHGQPRRFFCISASRRRKWNREKSHSSLCSLSLCCFSRARTANPQLPFLPVLCPRSFWWVAAQLRPGNASGGPASGPPSPQLPEMMLFLLISQKCWQNH